MSKWLTDEMNEWSITLNSNRNIVMLRNFLRNSSGYPVERIAFQMA